MYLQSSANSKEQFAEKKIRQIVLHVRQIGFRQRVPNPSIQRHMQVHFLYVQVTDFFPLVIIHTKRDPPK